jgi:hypothetical protein
MIWIQRLEQWSPRRHVGRTVSRHSCPCPQNRGHMISWKLSTLAALGQRCEVWWRCFQCRNGWARAFRVRAVTRRAILRVHLFPRCRGSLFHGNFFDDWLLLSACEARGEKQSGKCGYLTNGHILLRNSKLRWHGSFFFRGATKHPDFTTLICSLLP